MIGEFNKKEIKEKLKSIDKLKKELSLGNMKATDSTVSEAIDYCINLHKYYQKSNSLVDLVKITELINELEFFRLEEAIRLCRKPLSYTWLEYVAKNEIFNFRDVLTWKMQAKSNGITNEIVINCVEKISKLNYKKRSRIVDTSDYAQEDIKEELEDQFIIEKNYIKDAKERIMNLIKLNNGKLHKSDYFKSLGDINSIRNAIALSYLLNDEALFLNKNGTIKQDNNSIN